MNDFNASKSRMNLKDLKNVNIEEVIKYYVNRGFELMGLYYESLQALVEGKR